MLLGSAHAQRVDGAEALLVHTQPQTRRLCRQGSRAIAGARRLLSDWRRQLANLRLTRLATLAIVAQQIIGGGAHHAAVATLAQRLEAALTGTCSRGQVERWQLQI